jgi:hypothetical protein
MPVVCLNTKINKLAFKKEKKKQGSDYLDLI